MLLKTWIFFTTCIFGKRSTGEQFSVRIQDETTVDDIADLLGMTNQVILSGITGTLSVEDSKDDQHHHYPSINSAN